MIRLFVIEDHLTMIVSSLKYMFRPGRDGIVVADSVSTIDDALRKADPKEFDLFILDLYIPGHKPIDNIRKLKEHFPDKPVAIYTSEKSNSWKKRMMDEGASTYIIKNATREELKLAIEKAAAGEYFFYGKMESDEPGLMDEEKFIKVNDLTPIQTEIVKLLSEGLTHKAISKQLGISRSMIEKILKVIRKKFEVSNNIELVKLFIHLGAL
jgi:DNA-binding NarL/FixJ family response regulator